MRGRLGLDLWSINYLLTVNNRRSGVGLNSEKQENRWRILAGLMWSAIQRFRGFS